MTTINVVPGIEQMMVPQDIEAMRRQFPSLLQAFKIQQTVINQIIQRVGGSTSSTPDLSDIYYQLDAAQSASARAPSIAAQSYESAEIARQAVAMASSLASIRREVSAVRAMVDELKNQPSKSFVADISKIYDRLKTLEESCL